MISFLPYIDGAVHSRIDRDKWTVEGGRIPDGGWISVSHSDSTPQQGWKLHVSANQGSAVETLERVLPVLLADTASFKVAASGAELNGLNEGFGGLSQVGKFITVYPRDDAQAVALAIGLEQATSGLRGPRIPSDRQLRRGSVVHYRYGGFGDLFLQTPMGQILPALRTPGGDLVPDHRGRKYTPPEWVSDPFVAAGVADGMKERERLVGGRYLIVATLYESARGAVLSGIDVSAPRTCIIKQARTHTVVGRDGRDACDRLRHEMAMLNRFSGDDRVPQVLDLVEQDDELFLVMTDVGGVTLEQHVKTCAMQGCLPGGEQLFNWTRELVRVLRMIHDRGILYRDLKSSNIFVGEDGSLRIVDFELAAESGTTGASGRGTRGYFSPQQEDDQPPTVADDIFGLGAILYFAATGAEPSLAPHPFRLLDRTITLLNPDAPSGFVGLVEKCLDPDHSGRFPSMQALEESLVEFEEAPTDAQYDPPRTRTGDADASVVYCSLAARLGDTLCQVARSDHEGRVYWRSTHENRDGFPARDLSIGSAGAILALAELVSELGQNNHRELLTRAAHTLAMSKPSPTAPLPGLYVGEAGVGAALLRAGQVLGDADLIESALETGRFLSRLPYRSPDIFNGTAGRLRFHLWLWEETSDPAQLAFAQQSGRELLNRGEGDEGTGLWWTIPAGYDGLSGSAYVGYAHGAAGIGDALLDLFEVTRDESLLSAVRGTGTWIARHAFETLEDASGLDWPDVPGGTSIGPFWCHGAAGVGQFFLHAARLGVVDAGHEFAVRAARSVAAAARWSSPTQCHGLAGNIEFLLDMFQATSDASHLHDARLLGRILRCFALETDGCLTWPSESPATVTPDYTVGYAGVAACLLRLAFPDRLPRQLSRCGFSPR
jgi:serine/threonine protein kinase